MYLPCPKTRKHDYWVIDIETDGLDATVIWVLCVTNAHTGESHTLTDYPSMKAFIDAEVRKRSYFVGHNSLAFDVPTLNRLLGCRIPVSLCVDTFILSMVYSPSLAGGHSLDAWARRLGMEKIDFKDWSKLSDEMITYCLMDVSITVNVFLKLVERMLRIGFTERGIEIEHKAWHIIQKQKKNGFAFDFKRAHILYAKLREIEGKIKKEIYEFWPPQLQPIRTFAKAYKQDGTSSSGYEKHLAQYPRLEILDDGRYTAHDWVEFSIGSPQQRVEKLLELGWEPREFTPITDKGGGGNPKVTDNGELVPSLVEFLEKTPHKGATLIAEWITVNNRANAISTWMNAYNEKTGCIHGTLFLAGTLRYRHSGPNTANIPAVRVDKAGLPLLENEGTWTYESRDLWTVRNLLQRSLVGVDAKGIQLRVLAHYLDDDDFTAAILSEDPHAANQKTMGLPTRALTKTITYATLMGAGDAKIAAEANISLKEAKAAKKQFLDRLPGLKNLIKRLKSELKQTGRITLCDGTPILCSSDHMVIPYLLQGDESRIMKQAAIYIDEAVRKEKLDALKVGDIHDEHQSDVSNEDVARFEVVCHESFRRAGTSFDYKLPIECSPVVGLTWAETH